MTTTKLFKILLLLISLSGIELVHSEELDYNRFQYGIFGNIIIINQNADFRNLPGYPTCSPGFQSGNGKGLELGLLAEYPLFKNLFAGTRLGFEQYSDELTTDEPFPFQDGNTVGKGLIEHSLKTNFNNVFGDLYLGFRPFGGMILSAGIKISLPFSPTFTQKEVLKSPTDYGTFENDKRERNVYSDKDLPNYIKPIAIAKFGLSYELPLNEHGTLRLAPEISYNYPITPVVGDLDWYKHSLRAGAALKFSKTEDKPLEVDISGDNIIEIRNFRSCDTAFRLIVPESLVFTPTVFAPAKVRNWEFSLSRGEQILTQYKSKDSIPEKMILPITADTNFINNIEGEYTYKLVVQDRQNKVKVSEKKLRIVEKNYSLGSSISGYGIDIRDGKRYTKTNIQLLRKISTNVRPLLNYIFFDTKNVNIPDRYGKIDNNLTYSFDEKKMHNLDAIQIYRQMLNVLGKRMRENPESEITLAGYVSALPEEFGNAELAKKRAGSVREYLSEVWNIDTARIKTEISTRPSGLPIVASMPGDELHITESAEENQRVEIIPHPEHTYLLDPVITTDTLNQVFPLQFVFKPSITASGQDYHWQLNLAQNDKLFAKYNGDKNLPDSIVLNLKNREAEMIDKGGNLHYEFFVQDEFGQKCINSGEIQVELMKLDSSFYKYSLILFEYESFNIEQKNKQIITLIKDALASGSSLEVTGFTDALGDSTRNRVLSKNRALFTTKEILEDLSLQPDDKGRLTNYEQNILIDSKFYQQLPKTKDITNVKVSVFGAGEDLPLLYDNSTPEGRFYCRTVTVNVVNEQQSESK